jgi:hypothetical protein
VTSLEWRSAREWMGRLGPKGNVASGKDEGQGVRWQLAAAQGARDAGEGADARDDGDEGGYEVRSRGGVVLAQKSYSQVCAHVGTNVYFLRSHSIPLDLTDRSPFHSISLLSFLTGFDGVDTNPSSR